jgi:hypothetical protein
LEELAYCQRFIGAAQHDQLAVALGKSSDGNI